MRRALVAGNWKMNGTTAGVRSLVEGVLRDLPEPYAGTVALCPPFVYLQVVAEMLHGSHVALGAQNLHHEEDGAFTGEVSGSMLVDCGCRYVLVGHSERRRLCGEGDETVARKFARALQAGLTPVLCIGETLEEREKGEMETVVARQIDAVRSHCGGELSTRAVIAYEPVWAIGTGRNATPDQAQSAHAFIREHLGAAGEQMCIVYGGSVKADNARSLFAMSDIDGGLIGGASLVAADFVEICRAVH